MAPDYGKHSPVAAVILLVMHAAWSQRVRVEPEVEAYPSESVDLRCQFAQGVSSTTKLTQVSWIWEPMEGEKRENIAVYHPIYGKSFPDSPFSGRVEFLPGPLESPSIKISQLKMADAGRYTCEFATYPSGNEQGTTTLIMLSKPKNSASTVTVEAGSGPVVVAQCTAADGKPAAAISWQTAVPGNHSTTSKAAADGTVTVRSEFRMVPTAADNGKELTCVVTQRTQDAPQRFPMALSVEYPPTATIQGYDENWYIGRSEATLVCEANSNPPPASVTWTSLSGSLPDTVQVNGNLLTVRRVDETVNTTFVCEVKNRLGVSTHQLTTIVIEPSVDPSSAGVVAGAVIGSLLALLLVGALIGVLVNRSRRQRRAAGGYPGNGDLVGGAYGNKARLFNSGKNGGAGPNNNGPIYTYREDQLGMGDKASSYRTTGTGTGPAPSAHDILLSGELDEVERRKFSHCLDDSLEEEEEEEEEEERYDSFGVNMATAYHIGRGDEEMTVYLDDDMESQRDGSVISRNAIYV